MDNDLAVDFAEHSQPENADAMDASALERILDLGDAELRQSLCAQLIADFARLRQAIGEGDGAAVSRAAHELKGLAATIGAERIAEQARGLDFAAESVGAEVRRSMALPIQREVAVVIRFLRETAGRPVD